MKTPSLVVTAIRSISLAAFAALIGLAPCSQAQIYTIDTSNVVLSGDGAINPSGIAPDFLPYFAFTGAGSGSITWTLPAGNYIVDSYRQELNSLSYLYAYQPFAYGGVSLTVDYAYGPVSDATVHKTFLGYYHSDGTSSTFQLGPGSAAYSRITNVTFTKTNDIYFDENSTVTPVGDAVVGAFSVPTGFSTTLFNASAKNGLFVGIGGNPGGISGTVNLVSGQQYAVYASRQVNSSASSQMAFDLDLDGSFFANINATPLTAPDDGIEEIFVGNYTPSTNSIDVVITNTGAFGGRADYIRFAAVPEPSAVALVTGALVLTALLKGASLRKVRCSRTA